MTDHADEARKLLTDYQFRDPSIGWDEEHAAYQRATALLLLAIHDTLNRPAPQPPGACPAGIETRYSDTTTDLEPCVYLNGHTGAHRDEHGRTWHTEPIRVPRCQHHSTDGRQCTLTLEHPGIGHTDLTGTRWTTDNPTPQRMLNTDKQCTHTPDGDRRCLLDPQHPGQHITRTRGTDPCTADNGQAAFNTSRCARDADHTGPHTTYAGKDF